MGLCEACVQVFMAADQAVRSVIFEMLKRLGFEVTTAGCGASALEHATHQSFDLVFLDLAMPNMSGIEVFSSRKQIKPESRGIFMTDYSKDEFGDLLADNEDTTSVWPKPLPMQELKLSVEAMLSR